MDSGFQNSGNTGDLVEDNPLPSNNTLPYTTVITEGNVYYHGGPQVTAF